MKKYMLLLSFLALFSVVLSLNVCAAVERVDCFDYYKFQEGLIFSNLHAEEYSYAPGEDAIISYSLENRMQSPIVEGKAVVQIMYSDPVEGEQIVDEFLAYANVSLTAGGTMDQELFYKIPLKAKEGKYAVKTYFLVGESFNLAGISFLPYGSPGLPGALIHFNVNGAASPDRIYFSKKATSVNNQSYPFGSFLFPAPSRPLLIKTSLVNEGPAKVVHVKLSVYEWDDIMEKPLADYTQERDINMAAGASEEITYSLPALEPAAYNVRLVAEADGQKSIMKLRIPIAGVRGRLGYMGLDSFPLVSGRQARIFFCLSNSADYSSGFNGTGIIRLRDRSGNTIVEERYALEVLPDPGGAVLKFTPQSDVTDAVLEIDLYDEKGNFMDDEKLRYSYSMFADVPSRLAVKTDKAEYVSGEKPKYSVSFTDNSGKPLSGRILLYVVDDKDAVVYDLADKEITGSLDGTLSLPSAKGAYRVIVREIVRDAMAQASFRFPEAGKTVTPTTRASMAVTTRAPLPADAGKTDWLLPLAVAVIILLIMALFLKRRGK